MGVFDKAIILVENERMDLTFDGNIRAALEACLQGVGDERRGGLSWSCGRGGGHGFEVAGTIGTG